MTLGQVSRDRLSLNHGLSYAQIKRELTNNRQSLLLTIAGNSIGSCRVEIGLIDAHQGQDRKVSCQIQRALHIMDTCCRRLSNHNRYVCARDSSDSRASDPRRPIHDHERVALAHSLGTSALFQQGDELT